MPRSSGTYTAPSSSVNPAVEGTVIDETDFNALVDDIESALTESVYTSGVGSTDNRLVRVDGTDTKKVQGSAATLDDSGNLSGIVNLSATGYIDVTEMAAPGNPAANVGRLYVADDSGTTKIYFVDSAGTTTNLLAPAATISDGDKGDITTSSSGATWTIDNGAVTYAKLQDVSATSRVLGRKTSGAGDAEELTASEVLDFISTTQGELLYRDASAWAALGVGASGQVLQSQGAGANPQWATVAGTGDVTSASNITDNRIVRGDGGAKGVHESAVAIDDSGNVTGVVALDIGNADTTLTRSGAGDVAIEGNVVYRAGGTDVALADGGTGASLTDPNADRILFWDDSAGAMTWLEAGSGLTISGTTISASGSGGGAAFKNRIINGDFRVAQRGTSFVAGANNDDTYNLDRWYLLSDGNDVVDVTRSTDVPTNGLHSIALDVETVNTKFAIAQIVEQQNCVGLIGETVTLSFAARVSSTAKLDNVKAAIIAWSGTADVVTSDVVSAWGVEGTNPTLVADCTYENSPVNLNVTNTWATYSVSATVDTANAKNIIVLIWSDVTDTTLGDFLYLTNVQLEPSATATAFENRPIGIETALCQRYFYRRAKTQNYDVIFMTSFFSTTSAWGGSMKLPVTMRTAGTLSVSAAGDFSLYVSTDRVVSSFTNFLATTDNVFIRGGAAIASGSQTVGDAAMFYFTNANNGWFTVDAEL